ncbi:single-stranded-DNA-specific exonuclease RecJ [Thermodesulfobacteriota bacterium]
MSDKIWRLLPPTDEAGKLADKTDISLLKARLLINRGITGSEEAESFLYPKLSNLSDPMLLKDMEESTDLIISVIEQQEKIAVYGDYDADGLTSTALLVNFFTDLGIPVSYYIPDRIEEGYSLNPEAIHKLAENGVKLIITVDCGISNSKEIKLAQSLGIKMVVTDHHQIPEDFSPLCPVINPHHSDSRFPFRSLAGVGVAFFLAAGIRARIRERGWFKYAAEPDLRQYLDIVALGTIADMAPLNGENRILVTAGIEAMKISRWFGIEAMKKICGIDNRDISSGDIAFKLAPRLNAPGRIGDNITGITALITDNYSVAVNTARELNRMNSERQMIEGKIIDDIEENILPEMDILNQKTILLSKPGWHKGVLGIVASRLLDKYHRPTIILTIKDGVAVGSGRSIDGFNIHEAMTELKDLFIKFGGHYHAAGCTLDVNNIDALSRGIEEIAEKTLSDVDLVPSINVDEEVNLDELTLETVYDIRPLEPFGAENPEPVLYSGDLEILGSRIVGEKHLKLRVRQGQMVHDAIGFNFSDMHPLNGRNVNMVYTPEINNWNGNENVQLRILDIEISGGESRLVRS